MTMLQASDLRHRMGLGIVLAMVCMSGVAQADKLCPDTTKIGELSISDGSDLQFDIDRLGLCLQRARLLQQIDETVKKREVIRAEPLSVGTTRSGTSAGLGGGSGLMIPQMPSPPDLPNMPQASPPPSRSMTAPALVDSTMPSAPGEWKIQRIWGQGDGMQAQLVKGDVIANVKQNDVLPTGEKVLELSARGVTLDNGKTKTALNWLENIRKNSKQGLDSNS